MPDIMKLGWAIFLATVITIVLNTTGCSDLDSARLHGGVAHIKGEKGMEVVGVTWKDGACLWVTYRKRPDGVPPQEVHFVEHYSDYRQGGRVVITER
jgi:hypothetical protein